MASTGIQKEINELKKLVIANGFKIVPNGRGHMKLLDRKGRVVTDADGPVILSSSASDHRARDMHVKRLLGVGALKADPWKPEKAKSETDVSLRERRTAAITSEEARQKSRDVQAEQSRERGEKTRQLRSRVEPFIAAIGGWGKKGTAAEFARAAYHFLDSRNRVENWETESGAQQNCHQLKLGNTLSERSISAWHLVMDEIERGGDTIDERRERYFDLVRESKGLATAARQAQPPPGDAGTTARILQEAEVRRQEKQEPEPEPVPLLAPVVSMPGRNGHYKTPTLALKALAEMMNGTDDALLGATEKRDRALMIAEEILDMEIRQLTGINVGVQPLAEAR